MDWHNIPPLGILSYIYRLPIEREERLAMMAAVDRIITKERLELEEKMMMSQGDFLSHALEKALVVRRELQRNGPQAMWDELTSVIWEKQRLPLSADGGEETKTDAVAESRAARAKDKDEQKARMLQSVFFERGLMNKEEWGAVTIVIDRGHQSIGIEEVLAMDRAGLEGKIKWLAGAYQCLIHDQTRLLGDIEQIIDDEKQESGPFLGHFFEEIGISAEEITRSLGELEEKISESADNCQRTIERRMKQFSLLRAVSNFDERARAAHLIRAFNESLRVLFDTLAAINILIAELEAKRNGETFQTLVAAAIRRQDEKKIDPSVDNFRLILLAADDLLTARAAAQESGEDKLFDYQKWDELTVVLSEKLRVIGDGYVRKKVNLWPVHELSRGINKVFADVLKPLRTAKERDTGLIARINFLADFFREAVNAAARKKENGYFVQIDDWHYLTSVDDYEAEEWLMTIQYVAEQAERVINKALDSGWAGDKPEIKNKAMALLEVLGFVIETEGGWEEDLEKKMADCLEAARVEKKASEEIIREIENLRRFYLKKPFVLLKTRVESDFVSGRPFLILPLAVRKEKLRQITVSFKLWARLAMEEESIAGSVAEDVLGRSELWTAAGILDEYILPHLALETIRDERIVNELGGLSLPVRERDLTRELERSYNSENAQKLDRVLVAEERDREQMYLIMEQLARRLEDRETMVAVFLRALH